MERGEYRDNLLTGSFRAKDLGVEVHPWRQVSFELYTIRNSVFLPLASPHLSSYAIFFYYYSPMQYCIAVIHF